MPLNDTEKRIIEATARRGERLRSELAAHVAIPTGRNHAPGLNRYRSVLVERLRVLGGTIEVIEGALRPEWIALPSEAPAKAPSDIPPVVIARSNGKGKPRILLVGHLDTVHDPVGTFQSMAIQPDGRTAIGPGVVDMKGGILIAVSALEVLHELGIECNWTFLLNSDEETGSFHSAKALADVAKQHDIGMVFEPALPDGSLVIERMGSGQFKIEVFGRSAHVGRDFEGGVNAVNKLAELIQKVAALGDSKRGLIVNIGPLSGGGATNVVPDFAACWGNLRFKDNSSAQSFLNQLDAMASASDAMPRVVVHHVLNRPAKPKTDGVMKIAEAARRAAEDLGQKLPFNSTGGVCDGNNLQAVGLPTIDTLGVRGGNLHRTDEFIEVASLVERCQLLAVLLARLSDSP